MKGIIFTEFIEMVEDKFGYVMADKLLNQPELKSEGVYTAVGTYDFEEMIVLLKLLSKESKTQIPDLLKFFGTYLFARFYVIYPHFFEDKKSTFDFLSGIHDYIHVEVLKLYPDAQLPTISTRLNKDKTQMTLIYNSNRKLSDLAVGLIDGAIKHFNERIEVKLEEISDEGRIVKFLLVKK